MQVTEYISSDPILTNVSVAYTNEEYIADMILPRMEVNDRKGSYYKWDKAKFRQADDRRTGSSRANRVSSGLTKQTFGPLSERSLEEAIEWDVMRDYPGDPKVDATETVTEGLLLNLEIQIADALADTSTITQNTTLSGTDQWSDYSNSDPFGDIQTGMDAIQLNAIKTPNTVWMGYQVWAKLRHHPDALGRMSVSVTRSLTPDDFADILGIKKVIVAKSVKNTAAEGQTDSMSYIWGKHFWVGYITDRPGVKQVTLGYILTLKGGRYIDRWSEPQTKEDVVRANDYYDEVFMAVECVYLVKNAVA